MDRELNIGDKVLIFNYISQRGINQNYNRFIEGIVIHKELSDDLSQHGSPWEVMNYRVLGEDGKKYFGNYIDPVLGDSFFMTREDYINHLRHEKNILKVLKENENILLMLKKYQEELEETNRNNERILNKIEDTVSLCLGRLINEKE